MLGLLVTILILGFHWAAYKIYLTIIVYMDDHIRKLDTRTSNRETELNALYTKIKKLEEEIATLYHKKLISKKRETAEMSLNGVLKVIFETEEEKE